MIFGDDLCPFTDVYLLLCPLVHFWEKYSFPSVQPTALSVSGFPIQRSEKAIEWRDSKNKPS
jgi:hypothetical protein